MGGARPGFVVAQICDREIGMVRFANQLSPVIQVGDELLLLRL
jgi:hypothetical protein